MFPLINTVSEQETPKQNLWPRAPEARKSQPNTVFSVEPPLSQPGCAVNAEGCGGWARGTCSPRAHAIYDRLQTSYSCCRGLHLASHVALNTAHSPREDTCPHFWQIRQPESPGLTQWEGVIGTPPHDCPACGCQPITVHVTKRGHFFRTCGVTETVSCRKGSSGCCRDWNDHSPASQKLQFAWWNGTFPLRNNMNNSSLCNHVQNHVSPLTA